MINYKKMLKSYRNSLNEAEDIDELEEFDIELELSEIADNLGYTFMPSKDKTTEGTISVSDELTIYVRYINNQITRIYIKTDINNDRIDCTRNTTNADNMSVELQTCVLIIKDIKQKLM